MAAPPLPCASIEELSAISHTAELQRPAACHADTVLCCAGGAVQEFQSIVRRMRAAGVEFEIAHMEAAWCAPFCRSTFHHKDLHCLGV